MLANTIKEQQPGYPGSGGLSPNGLLATAGSGRQWPIGIMLCALSFVVCILLTVTPLMRMPDPLSSLHISAGSLLALVSSWLPTNLGTAGQPHSAYIEFFLLLFLASLCYGCGALLVRRRANTSDQYSIRSLIWIGAILAGAIYVVTPAMLSHDILVYASYSRVLATYHANPYFVPISYFPQDPFTATNYWAQTVSAYGPIWTLICGFWGWLLSPDLTSYTLVFRIFALAIHLLNIWLVGRTLQTMDRSPRTVTLGMLLYAWNPLTLLESSLGGHNDIFMITFVLAGVLLAVRAEKSGQLLHARGYLPPTVALTLAVLVKFTALPILAVYLLFLACKALRPAFDSTNKFKLALRNWRPALLILTWSGLVAMSIALAFYGPFWFGHSLQEIIASFKSPPSAFGAENSFLRSVIEWSKLSPENKQNSLAVFLNNRHLWDDLNFAAIAICMLLGAIRLWSKPTTRTFVTVALATLCVVLLITPWFFSWYITWIISLAVVCLPMRQSRTESALLALTLTFSFSALLTYLFNGGLAGSQFYLVSLFSTIPPACAFVLTMVLWRPVRNQATGDAENA